VKHRDEAATLTASLRRSLPSWLRREHVTPLLVCVGMAAVALLMLVLGLTRGT
jgi:hypothetical protein